MSVITSEQQIALERNSRFQEVCQQYVKFIAQYLFTQDGTSGNTGGRTPTNWARETLIASGVVQHPNSQNYQEWAAQMNMRLKGQDVWVPVADADPSVALSKSIDATITSMIDSGKFEELSNDVFAIRGSRVEFR